MKKNIQTVIAGIVFAGSFASCSAMSGVVREFTDTSDLASLRQVAFNNPCYPKYSPHKSVIIPNGSMLNFASSGGVGKTIRAASAMNEVPNPLGLTHSGVTVNEDPAVVHRIVLNLTPRSDNVIESEVSYEEGKAMLDELEEVHHDLIAATHAPEILAPFSVESDGSAGEVLSGVKPHVHLHDLGLRVQQYEGNVYLRPLSVMLTADYTQKFLVDYLGKPYESVTALGELINSVNDGNTTEGKDKLFCSELAGYFYKGCGLISEDSLASNMIPEEFSSHAGEHDLLAGHAGEDIPLKEAYKFGNSDLDGSSCFGRGVRRLFGFFQRKK